MEIIEEIIEHTHFCLKCQTTYNCPRPALKLPCSTHGNKRACCKCSKHPDALKAWIEKREYCCHRCGKVLSWKGSKPIDPREYESALYSPKGDYVCDISCMSKKPVVLVETEEDFQRLLSQKPKQSFLDISQQITQLDFEEQLNCENLKATNCICECKEDVTFTYADFRKHLNLNNTNLFIEDGLISIFLCRSHLDINHKLQYIDYYCANCKLPIRIYYDFEEVSHTNIQLYKYKIELLTIDRQLFIRQPNSLLM